MLMRVLLRGGTAAEWTAANPILAARELGTETDTGKFKIGNGVTAWNALAYSVTVPAAGAVVDASVAVGAAIQQSKISGLVTALANLTAADATEVTNRQLSLKTVIDFGADKLGVADSTAAIDAAGATGSVIFPPGTYIYNGTGITNSSCIIRSAGQSIAVVVLGATSYLYAPTTTISEFRMSGLRVVGGKGAVRQSFAGVDSGGAMRVVEDCYFLGYTEAAICSLASDAPYWKIRRNIFSAANDISTMGIVMVGLADVDDFSDNDFRLNRIHIKLKKSGSNAHLKSNAFLRFAAYSGTPRVDVWVVPNATSPVSGAGLVIDATNRFGNENLNAADYRVLYADEDTSSGTDAASYFPQLGADSAGFITGHRVAGTFFSVGAAGSCKPLVFSTTPNLIGCHWGEIISDGGESMVVGTRSALPRDRTTADNVIGPYYGSTSPWARPVLATDRLSLARIDDPQGSLAVGTLLAPQLGAQSNPTDYVNQLALGIRGFSTLGGGALANVTDSQGGADASELTTTGSGSLIYGAGVVAAPTTVNMWVEFDLAPGSSTPLATVQVTLQDFASQQHRTWFITTPASGWVPIVLGPHNWRVTPGAGGWYLIFQAAAAGKVQVGRVRMYQARNPILSDLIIPRLGGGLRVKEGTNAKQGVSTLVAGTVTVSNTSTTATSRILLTVQSLGTVTTPKAVGVTARTAGTSFTITSADATDTSVVAWEIFEPAA